MRDELRTITNSYHKQPLFYSMFSVFRITFPPFLLIQSQQKPTYVHKFTRRLLYPSLGPSREIYIHKI